MAEPFRLLSADELARVTTTDPTRTPTSEDVLRAVEDVARRLGVPASVLRGDPAGATSSMSAAYRQWELGRLRRFQERPARAAIERRQHMTEQQWLTSADPQVMLDFLTESRRTLGLVDPSVSDQRLRLFACGCCRLVWPRLVDDAPCGRCGGRGSYHSSLTRESRIDHPCPDCLGAGRVNRSRAAVVVAEKFADGEATEEEMWSANVAANIAQMNVWERTDLASGMQDPAHPEWSASLWAYAASLDGVGPAEYLAGVNRRYMETSVPPAAQAGLLRCVFGNPWKPVTLTGVKPGDKLKMLTEPNYRLVSAGLGDRVAATVTGFRGGRMVVEPANAPGERAVWDALPPCWLTPTVLALAEAAYHERLPDVKCQRCTDGMIGPVNDREPCPECPDAHPGYLQVGGLLDPVRLVVLADALEEAGAPGTVECTHTVSDKRRGGATGQTVPTCQLCPDGYGPNPFLAHLRGPGPHVRGCWAVDLVLGKADAPAPRRPHGRQTGPDACPHCDGHGTTLGAGPDRGNPTCNHCGGTGRRTRSRGAGVTHGTVP